MKFDLIFDNSNDVIPFEVVYNKELIEWFINKADNEDCNKFFNNDDLHKELDKRINDLHWALSKTNETYWLLSDENFPENNILTEYLDQQFLNRQHALWVKSQYKTVDIDMLLSSSHPRRAEVGRILHDAYPDDIRKIPMAQAMKKLGCIYPYEEVNMTVHRLETIFTYGREYSAQNKWAGLGFENIFHDSMVSNMDRVNFSFGYTFVGRQYYNKWQYWDTELACDDHYNYERLEWSFQMNLARPETLPWSPEFLSWTQEKQVTPVYVRIPIANIVDLEKNLTKYRKILYHNSKQNNGARLVLI